MNIFIDLGNSRCKIKHCGKYQAINYSTNWLNTLDALVDSFSTKIYFSSVNSERLDELITYSHKHSIPIVDAMGLFIENPIIDISLVSTPGADRIFGLVGALSRAEPPLVTIDCGTAITINAMSSDKIFMGGAIMPGIYTQMRSLSDNTSQLNSVNLIMPLESAGKTTIAAIQSGIMNGTVGAIHEILSKILEYEINSPNSKIFMTGGYSQMLAGHLRKKGYTIDVFGGLVLDGIAIVAEM